ncbi:MAG: hypothetical protein KC416_08945 [Myxococcales bacterium]|nr:hypothetical protein [Myxococcales bacterium]
MTPSDIAPENTRDLALLEERRQGLACSELSLESERIAGGWANYSGPGAWLNEACALGLEGPVTADDVAQLIEFYASRGAPAKVDLCPYAHETLAAELAAAGFVLAAFRHVLMRLLGDDVASATRTVDGIDIRIVDPSDAQEVDAYIRVATSGFLRGEPLSKENRAFLERTLVHPRHVHFLASVDGVSAGGGGLEVTPDLACLFGASVLPTFQRRGIQGALIRARLTEAARRGAPRAIIQSTPGIPTERNAGRAGFRVAYTKAEMVRPAGAA